MTQFGNDSGLCFYFLFVFVRCTTPLVPAAEFLYFHGLPCSRCLCRHAELFSCLLVPLKIWCFVQVELWQVLQRRTWSCLGCSAASPARLRSCLSSSGTSRGEPHRSHLCGCAARGPFCLLRKKRQLKNSVAF